MRRSNRTIVRGALGVAALVALSVPMRPLLADTTLNSGTTTVSTSRNFGQGLFVATTGTATMNVVAGGYATNSYAYHGQNAGGVGTANVSGGTWANSENLFVGYGGTGTLNVNGGSVTNILNGYLGYQAGSFGAAMVSSGTWANSSLLIVGFSGTGSLNVSGGSVTNTVVYLGYEAGSVGAATVSSGTWANSGNLTVGIYGTGTLTMNGGLVSVAGTLTQGTYGTINLNAGGMLQIGTGSTSGVLLGGTGSLVNNGTLIFNRSDASTYSGIISGTGAVTKQGAGTLTLDGANSYSGVTTISGGVLALSGTGSIGTGGLDLGTNGIFDLAALAAGTSTLPATGNLTGAGTLSGNGKTLAVLGSFLPGNSPGTVTLGSGFTLDLSSSGTSVFQITSPRYTAGSFDLVTGTGSVIFGGILNLDFSGGSYAADGNILQLFANSGDILGNFSSVVWTGLADGQSVNFNAATGSISVVPEPSTYALVTIGAGILGLTRWRKRRTKESEV